MLGKLWLKNTESFWLPAHGVYDGLYRVSKVAFTGCLGWPTQGVLGGLDRVSKVAYSLYMVSRVVYTEGLRGHIKGV